MNRQDALSAAAGGLLGGLVAVAVLMMWVKVEDWLFERSNHARH